ncbi:nucleoid-associated protein [Pseudomonas rossensis]|uniref:nucleoid-associated protein n=1 Tax=Pseudomonas rossensis TaxID=2305471 RepID=UPI0032612E26
MNSQVEISSSIGQAAPVSTGLKVISAKTADIYKKNLDGVTFYEAAIGKNWDLSKPTALDFVAVIERKFARNNKYHGFFLPTSQHMAPKTLSEYIGQKIDFDEMVDAFVQNACTVANEPGRGTLSLGHLVLVHYRTANDEIDTGRFLVVLVGKKGGYDFDADLQPIDLTSINTSDLRHAAMFDLTLFNETFPNNDGDAYLKFIAKNSKSDFFKEAFGCGDYVPNKNSVQQINTAILDFLDDPAIPPQRRVQIIEKVTTYLSNAAKSQKAVSIVQVGQIINNSLPVGSEKIGGFEKFVNLGSYTISELFQPTRPAAATLKSVDINDPAGIFKCSINIQAIGYSNSDEKPVIVDDDLKFITIPLTPQASTILKQILGEKIIINEALPHQVVI